MESGSRVPALSDKKMVKSALAGSRSESCLKLVCALLPHCDRIGPSEAWGWNEASLLESAITARVDVGSNGERSCNAAETLKSMPPTDTSLDSTPNIMIDRA
eukprot:1892779-Rhodomonas_salina.2